MSAEPLTSLRLPAVAGQFYEADRDRLAAHVQSLLDGAPAYDGPLPKAIIAPHAGYIYSGPVAASIYARLRPLWGKIRRVVLVGPSHRVGFSGIAASTALTWRTPLGDIPIDRDALAAVARLPNVGWLDAAHLQEHSLEVHLPFLQTVLGPFELVPLVVGDAPPAQVAAVLEALWGGPETLIVISSDLSHYQSYDLARQTDARTRAAIERLDATALEPDQACGRIPVAGLLLQAQRHGMTVETVDLRTSGDTAGPRDKVVGYGAWSFVEPPALHDVSQHGPTLLALARAAIDAALRGESKLVLSGDLPAELRSPGAAFVTLKQNGALRGCIGSPQAWRPLLEDVADNAVKAALKDPRFRPLTIEEWPGTDLSVSVLTPPESMKVRDEADLLAQLRPHEDGLIIEDGPQRALFLPAVWEVLPEPRDFLHQLKQKAGLPADHWSPRFRALRFHAVEMK